MKLLATILAFFIFFHSQITCSSWIALVFPVERKTLFAVPAILQVLKLHCRVGTFFFSKGTFQSSKEHDSIIPLIRNAHCEYGFTMSEIPLSLTAGKSLQEKEAICQEAIIGARTLGPDASAVLFPRQVHDKIFYNCCRDNGLAFVVAPASILDFDNQHQKMVMIEGEMKILSVPVDNPESLSRWLEGKFFEFRSVNASLLELPHLIFIEWWKLSER